MEVSSMGLLQSSHNLNNTNIHRKPGGFQKNPRGIYHNGRFIINRRRPPYLLSKPPNFLNSAGPTRCLKS